MEEILTMEAAQPIFNYNFKRLFKAWGGSQGELARLIGVTQSRISYWVHSMSMPTFVNLYNLALVFGCDVKEFYAPIAEEKDGG